METTYSARGLTLTAELEKYAAKKLARINRHVPRRSRKHATCVVDLQRRVDQDVKLNTCTITLSLGQSELRSQETTQHMYAALDIAVVQIEHQLKSHVKAARLSMLRRHTRRG